MSGLGTALKVELRKTTTTRMWWILLLVMAGYVAVIAAFLAFSFTVEPPGGSEAAVAPLDDPATRVTLYTLVMPLAYVFPVLVGTLSITTEYRYKTLTTTFLGEPRRGTVLLAKLVVSTLVGLAFGVAGVLAGVAGVAPVLAGTGNEVGLDGEVLDALLKTVLGLGLWAAVGVGVGAVVRNQVAAIVVVVAFSQLLEPILRFGLSAFELTREVANYLPGAAGDAMAGASIFTLGAEADVLAWWQGGLVLAAYAAVLVAVGGAATVRRDVA
jgi:hypothetical protein